MNVVKMYRIFDEKDNIPLTLFHGTNGTRKIQLDCWIDSDTKIVQDGSGNKKKKYKSGFHVLKTFDEIVSFKNRFRNTKGRVVCKVDVDLNAGIWDKEHSPADVKLVKRMRVSSLDWENRIPLDKI